MARSSDELVEEIRQAKQALDEEKGGYGPLIGLYRQLRQQLKKEKDRDAAADVEGKLVYYLIEYGSYMKMKLEKRDKEAIDALKQALHFDRRLPLAHYRLGFLYYKDERFAEAGEHFSKALEFQEIAPRFPLDKRQLYYAHLYLISSELHVVYRTHKQMEKLEVEGTYEPLDSAHLSELYEKLMDTETYIENHAFVRRTQDEEIFLSKEEVEELEEGLQDKELLLYFGDRIVEVSTRIGTVELSKDSGEALFYLLHRSRHKALDESILARLCGEWEKVKPTTLRQRVSRLNAKLEVVGCADLITPTGKGYAIREEIPYMVVHRADEQKEALAVQV